MSLERLRDEFACAALNGLLACPNVLANSDSFKQISEWAYQYADAMLAERAARCPVCGQTKDPAQGFIVHESGCTYWPPADLPTGEL